MRNCYIIITGIFALLLSCAAPTPAINLADNVDRSRNEILAVIPVGTTMENAGAIMRANGFTCEPMRNAAFLNRERINFLYCDKSNSVGFLVVRRWQVALVEEQGKVTDVIVGMGLIGP